MALGQKISVGSSWNKDDDIAFERALAIYNDKTEIRWKKIATVVPGKTLEQVIEHYNILARDVMLIESGCIPLPDYDFSEEPNRDASDKERSILEGGNNRKREFKHKGDWRSISRHCVVTRTSTQVASHAQKYFARINSKDKKRKRPSIHDITVAENQCISTKQRPITWQNRNINGATTSNTQANQTTLRPSLNLPIYDRPNIWNTQATQAISQPSLNHPTYGASTTWNTQTALQPSANIPMYGTSTISQPMVGPMLSPFGTNLNRLAPPHMTSGVQHNSVPYYLDPSAPLNIDSIPFNIDLYN
ncbi:SANT domain [Arabidopsis thaliana x Arabidopsis arenosa]|uniref:SANT domain n=1 Tax=Arabidopsis thaliana x Arabidopsis arenosa TaxID=1240361 RepID=A0A8T1Z009_9BRAS|nr:SANT domain [Arabidopsis thaliana x Arabidopsis arenosa]